MGEGMTGYKMVKNKMMKETGRRDDWRQDKGMLGNKKQGDKMPEDNQDEGMMGDKMKRWWWELHNGPQKDGRQDEGKQGEGIMGDNTKRW